MKQTKKINFHKRFLLTSLFLIGCYWLSSMFAIRFDATSDKRYTLSAVTIELLKKVDQPLVVQVLLDGNLTGEFGKLKTETIQLLDEMKAQNSAIQIELVNPMDEKEAKNPFWQKQIQNGMLPVTLTINQKGQKTQEVVFPWALATYKDRTLKIPLLKNVMGAPTSEKINSSVQHLEYVFASTLSTLIRTKKQKVAVLKGNGEMADPYMADFIKTVRESYFIGTFTLDSVAKKPIETRRVLQKYDLAVMVKPTEAFTDEEKQVLDQYILHGGKGLWMFDRVKMDLDSLYNTRTSHFALSQNLQLDDLLFKYGIRLAPRIVQDLSVTPLVLAVGQQGSQTQYQQFPWMFSPLVFPDSTVNHPIVSHLDGVRMEFCSPIEVLNNGLQKTVLLRSSPLSRSLGTPCQVELSMVNERPNQADFKNSGNMPLAVLLEGTFHSVYENRILPFDDKQFSKQGDQGKLIVISDGDVIKNQFDKEYRPLELGFDKWTNTLYGNKEFLMNCVNYLLGDTKLLALRNKEVALAQLDPQSVSSQYYLSQMWAVGMPLLILGAIGGILLYLRKKRSYL
ncbi:MAG: gliding motility-associated ABC transporter substrate-binding protein GldG [Flavobacterium sp. BFFFF2]|nr:MAG: gliding motility-associated ABC transporter substrate-binding protein GldG [Flavobacterium sp. BFFFF2]